MPSNAPPSYRIEWRPSAAEEARAAQEMRVASAAVYPVLVTTLASGAVYATSVSRTEAEVLIADGVPEIY